MPDPVVVLVEDEPQIRRFLRATLIGQGYRLFEAGTGADGLVEISSRQPDVVIIDLGLPDIDGLEATRRIGKSQPATGVIILSMHASDEYVWQALSAGARGYLLKGASLAELELAISTVADDKTYLSPAISGNLVESYVHPASEHRANEILSPRQQEILQMIAESKSTKQIALALKISVKTVETHRSLLMKRLNVHDVASLVRHAVKIGLVDLQIRRS